MAHTYTDLLYHIVFSTKKRTELIVEEIKPRLLAYMGGIVRQLDGEALLVNGTKDHVHILAVLPPTVAVANAVRDIKANSSGWVHEQWGSRQGFAWQTGYGAFTVSESNRGSVLRYIEQQERHHHKVPFQDEFRALLAKHRVPYDEQYIWG